MNKIIDFFKRSFRDFAFSDLTTILFIIWLSFRYSSISIGIIGFIYIINMLRVQMVIDNERIKHDITCLKVRTDISQFVLYITKNINILTKIYDPFIDETILFGKEGGKYYFFVEGESKRRKFGYQEYIDFQREINEDIRSLYERSRL